MSRPTLLNLETALWVNRLGTFAATAQKMHATQPAISLRIRELEAALDTLLFERKGHRMEPTVEGRKFLHRIEPLVTEIQEVLGSARDSTAAQGVIRIGSGDIPMTWFGNLIGQLQREMPDVNYELYIGIARRLLAQLEEGRLDFVLMAGRVEYPTLTSSSLGRTPMRWVMAEDRWRIFGADGGKKRTLAQLLNAGPIWLIPRDSPYFAGQVEMLKAQGADLRNVNSCDNMNTLIELVARNGGMGYLPMVLIEERLRRGELVEVAGMPTTGQAEYFIVTSRGHQTSLVRQVVDLTVRASQFAR
ncbi:LysR family transcriptional regulator [Bordetella petrii]|nr:LysR family transcriptional regulator [Bordetella petrii]